MKNKIKDYIQIILGTMISGFGIACFITPAKIASGGVSGIATIIYYLSGVDTGLTMILISLPLFIIGMKIFGPVYGLKSFVGMTLLSVFVSLFGQLTDYQGFLEYTDKVDILLSAIFGGVLVGGGIGFVMRAGSNTGGTDIVGQILNLFTPLNLGTCVFLCDAVVVIIGGLVFGLERALFAVCALYISGQTINFVVMSLGNKYAKTAYIVSDNYERISDRIINELHRGGTLLNGKGIYTQQGRTMLMAVVPNQVINQLTQIVHEEDEKAFMFVHETYQVLGYGFVPLSKMLDSNKSRPVPRKNNIAKKN
ncbi:MAG: YitT family protein [Spirochaetia bacterium]|nr:YitT family protein [Spirochaetia bacterium]